MNTETKVCLGCKNNFQITDGDVKFYEKMKAPAPKYCPDCRAQRRLVHRNERTLYRRACDLCKKESISIYPASTPWPVYCEPCWWGDGWNPKDFGMAYDPAKPFLEQFKTLQSKVPRIGLLCIQSINSEYTNNSAYNKNSYLIFASEKCEDCYYGRLIQNCKSVVDGAFVYDSELCYECVDCRGCYNCLFSERCQSSSDLLFCFDVRDSQNCILSVNLRHKQYCIENQQYTKAEFEKRKKEILASYGSIQAAKKRFEELRSQALVKYSFQTKCNDATGDYLFNCHEAHVLFDASNAKACKYLYDAEDPIDSYDCNNMYYKSQLCLDMMGALSTYNTRFSTYVFYGNDVEYSDNCHNTESCFGCIALKKSNYCILNKEYSKEEYEKLKAQIVDSMNKDGSYGSIFPPELSPFGYNETLAKDFFPLTEAQAKEKGFKWQPNISSGTIGKETIKKGEMPATIDEVTDEITKAILVCEACSRNFRITPGELQFYRQMHLPLPHKDFECRHQDRVSSRTPRKLWHRKCMNKGCPNEFETAYAPDRKEVIYCESCYQKEVA